MFNSGKNAEFVSISHLLGFDSLTKIPNVGNDSCVVVEMDEIMLQEENVRDPMLASFDHRKSTCIL